MATNSGISAVFCRTCATPYLTNVCLRFDSPEAIEKEIIHKINVIGLYVQPDDLLPKFICRNCVQKLELAATFVQDMQEAQKKLLAMLKSALNRKPKEVDNLSNIVKFEDSESDADSVDIKVDYNKLVKEEIENDHNDFLVEQQNHTTSESSSDLDLAAYIRQKREKQVKAKKPRKKAVIRKRRRIKPIITNDKDDIVIPGLASKIAARERILEADQTWSDYPWECCDCLMKFDDLDLLRSHSMKEHNRCTMMKCVDCVRPRPPFAKIKSFIDHVTRHRPALRLSCFYCNISFISIHQINIHKESAHKYTCTVCGEVFDKESEHEIHKKSYADENSDVTRKCPTCGKDFKAGKLYTRHLATHKPKTRDFFCDLCGSAFYSKGALASHVPTHSTERPYMCLICKSDFKTNFGLNRHMFLHDKSLAVVCDQCGRNFRNKSQLKGHLKVHSDEANFVCTFCEKRFKYMSNLTTHLRQHTGERPFCCETCNHSFTNHSNYYKHMKRRHNIVLAKPKKIL